jgi:hypothetical protein
MGDDYIRTIDINSAEEWDSIVRSFKEYDAYSLSGYTRAFQIHGDGLPVLFYYEGKGLRGFNVTMKRDIAEDQIFTGKIERGKWFDLVTPYGYGGWLLEGDGDPSQLDAIYTDLCRNQNIVCEFVRYHPMWDNANRMEQMYQVKLLGHTIAMDLRDEETIWNNIISKNRNMIRKAEKNGIEIIHCLDAESLSAFKKMYDETMSKGEAEDYYFFGDEFYNSISTDMTENAEVFTAVYEGKPISAAIMLFANGKLNYHLSGSDRLYRSLAPTNLLLYKAALWGYENGMKTFHLGGGIGSHEDNLFKFKRAFYKGELRQFAIGRKKFLPDTYDELNNCRAGIPVSSFFPEYRRPAPQSEE